MMLHHTLSAALRGCCSSSTFTRRVVGVLAVLLVGALFARPLPAEIIYGIANQAPATALVSWDSASPNNLLSGVFLTGLQPNETILGIDFWPSTNALYGLGSTSRLYSINPNTGAVGSVSALPFTPGLNGFSFGFDFNPVVNRIRVVSETNQNLVLDPSTGGVFTVAPNVFYAAGDPNVGVDPNLVDSAYSNNFAGASSTVLYGIDTGLDVLVTQNPTTGALTTVGPLGLNVVAAGGFDISGSTGVAYVAFLPVGSSQSSLFTINLATGAATPVGPIDGGLVITALAVLSGPVVPEPASIILLALCGLGLSAVVRCRS